MDVIPSFEHGLPRYSIENASVFDKAQAATVR